MARIKPENAPLPARKQQRARFSPRSIVAILLLVSMGIAAHFLWQMQSKEVGQQAAYALKSDDIQLSRRPAWVRSDVKSEVLRDSGLIGSVSVLEDWSTLARRIEEAFEFHPWIESVVKIERKLPRALVVEVKYRRPVAAVESSDVSGVALLPIDAHAIRLPEEDLSEAERRYLPRIAAVTGRPLVGDRWDDPRVVGGAQLAVALSDIWQQLRLVEILGTAPSATSNTQAYSFELVTAGGTRIVWGSAPGQELMRGESGFDQKRQRILDYAKQHGKLESIDGPEKLDVRSELVVTPRTARNKADAKTRTK